ncbi:MAG: InlB B-repeat-containing protein [Bacilli bacterium]|nr:InlB B-repeat-containing protein [Bacilli bacterium]
MKILKKGYTMIELLATIVVFTIIAVIGGNIVFGVMDKAREQGFTRSVEFAMSAFDFARQYNDSGIETIDITSDTLNLEHNNFISGTIILNDEGYAKVLYATDGNYCATGLIGNMVITKGDCVEDLTAPTLIIETTESVDQSELTIRLNATDDGVGLDTKAYSFDNGITWQENNELTIDSSYNGAVKVRDIVNNITTIDYSISKLTIDANSGVIEGLDEVTIHWLENDETMNVSNPIKIGYTFTGWTIEGPDSSIDGTTFTMGSDEATLTANYINATFTLTVNPNGGVWDTYTDIQTYSKIYESETTINTPSRIGYTFNGWTVSGENSALDGATFTMGNEDASLTAEWIINTYTLTVNVNGGAWSGATPQNLDYAVTTIIDNPTRTGYTFTGWTLSGLGSSINETTFTMGYANATLTANWVINYYTLTVNPNGGTWIGNTSQSLTTNNQVTIDTPTRNGYVFAGWSLTGSGSTFNDPTFTMGDADATLAATWYSYANMFTYTGSCTVIDDGSGNWRIKFLTSGTFVLKVNAAIDVFLVGGGSSLGGSGKTATYTNISINKNVSYSIVVGAGGAVGANGTASTAFGKTAAAGSGANGGSGVGASGYTWNGGTGGSNGSNGYGAGGGASVGTGQGSTTREFGETNGTIYAGGGGGGAGFSSGTTLYGGAGGAGGGGHGASSNAAATAGAANTGGGAGLGIRGTAAAKGGSGIVIIRNVRVPDVYTYTGNSFAVSDGNGNWRIKLLTSGTFTPKVNLSIDIFLVGGGGGSTTCPNESSGGSGGGYTLTHNTISLTAGTGYSATIGAGGAVSTSGTRGGTTTFLGYSAAGGYPNVGNNGGNGSSGGGYGGPWAGSYYCCAGAGASNGAGAGGNCASGGSGQGTTTGEFGDSTAALYGGGGGGYGGYNSPCGNNWKPGGTGGGGQAGSNAYPNTGGGGGACASGGSGIVVIRNHR